MRQRPTVRVDAALGRGCAHRFAPHLLFAWAFTEAWSWPIAPDYPLMVAALTEPRRAAVFTAAAVAGTTAGGMTAAAARRAGVNAPQPMVTSRMRAAAEAWTRDEGAAAVRRQPTSWVPYKVFAAEAGVQRVPAVGFAARTAVARSRRLAVAAAGAAAAGAMLRRWDASSGARTGVFAAVTVGFAAALMAAYRSWR